MPYLDFQELKNRISIEQVVQRLGLKVTKSQHQLRGCCPTCKSGGDRALAITPSKNLFFCFSAQSGGDQLQLAAHIRGEDVKEAATWLGGEAKAPKKEATTEGFQPLDYLEHEHPAVEAIGFDAETAKTLGLGYAPKGILKGTVAIPLRLPTGEIAGYVGATDLRLPPKFHLGNIIPFNKKSA